MPCTEPVIDCKNYVNCPNLENPETRNTDYEVFSGHVILLTKNHKATCFFCSEPKGPNVVYTFGQEKPTPFLWDCLKDIHSCDVVWKFGMFQPQICGASVYQK